MHPRPIRINLDGTRIIILCEDLQQAVFARYYLQACGANGGRIRQKPCPRGKQAGEQWVRECYAREVRELRRRRGENVALIVLIDADTYPLQQRFRQLDDELERANQARRTEDEPILIFVPKRNIETWIYFVTANYANENDIYRKLDRESDCSHHAKRLAREICPHGLAENAPSALHEACRELQRLL
jgi:hypothetical protein